MQPSLRTTSSRSARSDRTLQPRPRLINVSQASTAIRRHIARALSLTLLAGAITVGALAGQSAAVSAPPGTASYQVYGVVCPTGSTNETGCIAPAEALNSNGSGIAPALMHHTDGQWTPTFGPYPPGFSFYGSGAACPVNGSCIVPAFTTTYPTPGSDEQLGYIVTEDGQSWDTPLLAPTPVGTTPTGSSIQKIACASPGNCAAVGVYEVQSSKLEQPLLDVETTGTWANVVVPGDYSSDQGALSSVACLANGTCIAVGEDEVVGGNPSSLMVQETDGVLDSGGAVAGMSLASVACTTVTQLCVAGGVSGDPPVPMVLVETAPGQWKTTEPAVPGWQSVSNGQVDVVTCGATTCAGIGWAALNPGDTIPDSALSALLFSDLNGPSITTVFPDQNIVNIIPPMSCASDGNCLASDGFGLMYTETNGTWAQSVEPSPPGGGSPSSTLVYALYCFTASHCLGTGDYGNNHTLGAAFYDNNGTWTAVEVPRAVTPPTTAMLIPLNGAALSGTSAVLDATASAAAGVATVQFVLTGGSYNKSVIGTATLTIYGYLYRWNTTSVPGGTYTLQSEVVDKDGNIAYSAGVNVTVDNALPTTAVLIPRNGAALRGDSVLDAEASASFGVKITTVQFVLTGGSYNKSVISLARNTIFGWVSVWNTRRVPGGTYTLQSLATDAAGNTAYSPGITIKIRNPLQVIPLISRFPTVTVGEVANMFSNTACTGIVNVQKFAAVTGGVAPYVATFTTSPALEFSFHYSPDVYIEYGTGILSFFGPGGPAYVTGTPGGEVFEISVITVTVTDSVGHTASVSFPWAIANPNGITSCWYPY